MTHEHAPGDEAPGGPQHDDRLPDATASPVTDGPFDLVGIDRPYDRAPVWDDDMDPGYAEELAAAVALGLSPKAEVVAPYPGPWRRHAADVWHVGPPPEGEEVEFIGDDD